MTPAPRNIAAGLLLFVAASQSAGRADETTAPSVATVIAHWEVREQRLGSLHVEWRRAPATGADRFARCDSEWVPANPANTDLSVAAMRLDGDKLSHTSWRTAAGPHGYAAEEIKSITAAVGQAFPERIGTPYIRALLGRFADPDAERRSVQRFRRVFDGLTLHDFWEADGGAYPRATLHAIPEHGTAAWALCEYEHDAVEQLQTLELMAALLAVRPRHPLLGLRAEYLHVLPESAIVDGAPCLVLEERCSPAGSSSRSLLVDAERESLVRRFVATAAGAGVQIDIAYSLDPALGWTPASWTIMRFAAADKPVQQFTRATVTKVAIAEPISQAELTMEHPAGTWVVDRRSGQSDLVRAAGERRAVTAAELRWLPTYAELLQTESGQVGVLIERRVRLREQWGLAKWPLLVAGVLLCAVAASKWRGRRRRPTVS